MYCAEGVEIDAPRLFPSVAEMEREALAQAEPDVLFGLRSDHNGFSIAAMTALSASWIVVQLSTSVLSQSNKIARGRVRPCGAAAATLTALTPRPRHEPGNAPEILGRKRHAPLILAPP